MTTCEGHWLTPRYIGEHGEIAVARCSGTNCHDLMVIDGFRGVDDVPPGATDRMILELAIKQRMARQLWRQKPHPSKPFTA